LLFDKKIREIDNKINKQRELSFDMFSVNPPSVATKKVYKK
jgi:hypothetical protein